MSKTNKQIHFEAKTNKKKNGETSSSMKFFVKNYQGAIIIIPIIVFLSLITFYTVFLT